MVLSSELNATATAKMAKTARWGVLLMAAGYWRGRREEGGTRKRGGTSLG
jgi:hypothetical protein